LYSLEAVIIICLFNLSVILVYADNQF